MDQVEFGKRHPIFKGLPESDLQRLISSLRLQTFAKNAYLWREGDNADLIYFIESGLVTIYRSGRQGDKAVLLMGFPGDLIGEPAVLAGVEFRSVDAQALEETTCLLLQKEIALDFFDRHPVLLRRIMAWMRLRAPFD
jgi:CRP-like cAMP-binding protein